MKMPVRTGTDSKGSFFRWGGSGKKYYYAKGNKASMAAARAKAGKQGRAAHAAGYKGNVMLQRITANFTGGVRHDEMMGRKYLVAPMIMLVEGVHDGSGGPLLYLEEDMVKIPQIWNHKPIIVYHPAKNGEGISACDPVVLSNRQVGVIMNTSVGEVTVKIDNKDVKRPALKAEAWMEEDRMNKVDERIAEAVEKNAMMELSTGLFTDNESAEDDAEWNGEKYDAIARNYRPDHLALLPDLKGACSIEDGAGFLRLNAKPGKINITGNEMSHSNIRSLLNSWLQDKSETAWIEAVYDAFFVYEEDAKYYKYSYSLENNQITIMGNAEEVIRIIEWRTLSGEFVGNEKDKENVNVNSNSKDNKSSERKEQIMDEKKKVKLIDALIACNTNSWGKDDRKTLETMEDATLEKLLEGTIAAEKAVENATKKGAEEATKKMVVNQQEQEKKKVDDKQSAASESAEDDKGNVSADEKSTENEKPQTANEYIAKAPKEIREVLSSGMRSHNAIKSSLIKRITSNEKNQFTDDELKAKDLTELRKLVAILPGVEKVAGSNLEINDFEGLGDVEDITENVEKPMLMPAVVSAKKS